MATDINKDLIFFNLYLGFLCIFKKENGNSWKKLVWYMDWKAALLSL